MLAADVAAALVAGGRFVPGLEPVEGSWRATWWPLPRGADRAAFTSLVEAHAGDEAAAAVAVATEVDRLVRSQVRGLVLVPKRSGRPTAVEAWLRALTADDPFISATAPPARVAALAEDVVGWVRSGAVVAGRLGLVLRIVEPPADEADDPDALWLIELAVRDDGDPSHLVPLERLWPGDVSFGPTTIADVLGSLAILVRIAPELAPLLEEAAPDAIYATGAEVVHLLADRAQRLAEAGIDLLVPGWWRDGARLGLQARAARPKAMAGTAAVTDAGLGLDAIVSFTFEAALGDERLSKADLRRLEAAATAKVPLVQMRGEWVLVDPGAVAALLRRAGTRGQATGGALLRAGLGLDDLGLDGGVAVVGVDASNLGWLHTLLDGAIHARIDPIDAPPGFVGTLRPYQGRGVGWLAFLGRLGLGACLADDMGLGKTAQLIASLLADPVPGPTLVVCPVSVLGNWERELARFAPHLRVVVHHGSGRKEAAVDLPDHLASHDVVLTAYSLLATDQAVLAQVRWGRVVFDEAQQIKNPSTAQAKAAQGLVADRRVALTGTPVENRLGELWSIMHVLNPGLLGTAPSFRKRFAIPIEREHDAAATALLRRVTQPFVLRRLKTDRSIITDLPDKIETVDRCRLSDEQATLYAAVVEDLLRDADESEGIARRGRVLAGLLRLKQVCNHPALLLGDGSPLAGRSGKLERVEELLDEIVDSGDKVLCFTQFAAWGTMLVPHLERRLGTGAMWLHGGVKRAARDEMVNRFAQADGPPLFLISLKAGGTGLNLTAAAHVIHLDRWWNPAVEDQATDRAYRIGQTATVQVHKPINVGTIEERIDAMITAKRALAERVVGTGEDWLTDLSTADLRDVVALRSHEVA